MYLSSSASFQFDIVRAGKRVFGEDIEPPEPARGWQSRYYARKDPALSIALESQSPLPVRFVTIVALGTHVDLESPANLKDITVGEKRIVLSDVGCSPILI